MAKARWKVIVEFTGDDGEGDGEDTTVVSQTGSCDTCETQEPRAVNELVAITMHFVLRALMESGEMVCPSSMAGSIQAFGD